jgi:putative two-component system response regulator
VANESARIAQAYGLDLETITLLRMAAPLHDVGKIGIFDAILLKPGRLTPEEFEMMKAHTIIGGQIIGDAKSPLLKMAREIALSHHERWDGAGYPDGLSGPDTPVYSRIVAVADVYDALTHDRPYKAAWSVDQARQELIRQSGRHFDPDIVEAYACLW